jgi:SAM-dependent methyltransferase
MLSPQPHDPVIFPPQLVSKEILMNMHINAPLPVTLASLPEVVDEYEGKRDAIDAALVTLSENIKSVEALGCMGGSYTGSVFTHNSGHTPTRKNVEERLLESAWRHVYNGLNIDKIASAKDRTLFALALQNPPEFTVGNIGATFRDYLSNSRFHILKGLAECFTGLDSAYKSHSKVRIGVKGLPKRVIIANSTAEYGYGSTGRDRMRDAINALRVYQGRPHLTGGEFSDLILMAQKRLKGIPGWVFRDEYRIGDIVMYKDKTFSCIKRENAAIVVHEPDHKDSNWREVVDPEPGMVLKAFSNGNGHLSFNPATLNDINKALAEFYGEALPDAPDYEPEKQASTAVAKDLQFFWTSDAVTDHILKYINVAENAEILEPSCGDGRIMERLHGYRRNAQITGVEYDAGRVAICKQKGFAVMRANFLQLIPIEKFDLVFMNPPFYGLHWKKHVIHARKFLKPGGTLVSILPGSAFYDGHLDDLGVNDRGYDHNAWRDLPVASFSEAGTNVPTGFITLRRPLR